MNTADKKIADILAKYGEPMAGNTWKVQATTVIYHKALERIAAYAKIQFDPPQIIRAESDEAVVLVIGRLGDRMEWSFGEALIGTNYRVSGKQAAYPWAMSEKRAKDRVILKLIELSGDVYSENEADEFKGNSQQTEKPQPEETTVTVVSGPTPAEEQVAAIRKKASVAAIDKFRAHPDVKRDFDLMSAEDKAWVNSVDKSRREELKDPTTETVRLRKTWKHVP